MRANCFDREIEECDRVYETICKMIRKQPGYVVDWQLIDKAWKTAKDLHRDTCRKSGELYISHPRAVMEPIASRDRFILAGAEEAAGLH